MYKRQAVDLGPARANALHSQHGADMVDLEHAHGPADLLHGGLHPKGAEGLVKGIDRRKAAGKRFTIIAVAEGAISREDAKLSKKELKEKKKNGVVYPSIAYEIGAQLSLIHISLWILVY